ncbi:MAG: tryptophanase [Candidatus Eisenbacteria sp.]|nr:tryptophanase [Candidatus Eisenbacteria bacterium]
MTVIIEPFRIKSVEPIRLTTREERERILKEAGYNLFRVKSKDILIDFLTDSGTSAMSSKQWAAIMEGDESYAGSPSFFKFEKAVRDITGFEHIIPTHQGRAAERILFSFVGGNGKIIPNNTHFDTTRANVEFTGAEAMDLIAPEAHDLQSQLPFKGNMNLDALENLFREAGPEKIPLVMITVTNNSWGGQPVSMDNIRGAKEVCDKYNTPLFLDACRFAENAYLIKRKDPAYHDVSVRDIAKEMFSHADGCTMSAKKDAFANIGGFLAMNSEDWATKARDLLILTEGFPTYGGLAGRDLAAIAQGLAEVLEEDYLEYRLASTAYLGSHIAKGGVPIVQPVGAHAIYIDARRFLPHIPPLEFPGHALACELYLAGGVRGCEIGSLMFARKDPESGEPLPAENELVRLAIPRRVYTQSHVDYVVEQILDVFRRRESIRGFRIVKQAPFLRHFTAHLEPV